MAFKDFEDKELLRRVQLLLTMILGEFDRVCAQLEIPYVVYGGTAIGAVRHRGFIPWDDDADVCMLRGDYERFLREAPTLLGEQSALENSRTHADYPNMFTNMVLKGTLFIPEFIKKSPHRMPLGLDIFPLDNLPDDPEAFRKQARSTWFWGRLLYLQGTPKPYLEVEGPARGLILSATFCIYWALRIARVKPRFIQRQWEKAARRYEHQKTVRVADFGDRSPSSWAVTPDELYPAIDVPFESISVSIPREYDAVLSRGFGDYMELPPVAKRKNHQPYVIDLGEYGTEG